MRKEFADIITKLGEKDDKIIFLTGDIGFRALEGVQTALKERFINMGVAEQNMVSVAAGLAIEGYKVFCYSIAPFLVYRPLEQTRNDICFHNLPVFLVGNGGGYGYGIMGMSHHALEDLACLSSLPNMTCYVPSYKEDLEYCIYDILKNNSPAYLRLGLGLNRPVNAGYDFFYSLKRSKSPLITILSSGPVCNNIITGVKDIEADIFLINKFPHDIFNTEFLESIGRSRKLLVVEEHVKQGGLSQMVAEKILSKNIKLDGFRSLTAFHYPDNLYGSQSFHQKKSGIDPEGIRSTVKFMINA